MDKLKYASIQETKKAGKSSKFSNELLTVKVRYKGIRDKKSKKLEKILSNSSTLSVRLPQAFKKSLLAAQLGLLLKNSKYKGSLTFGNLIGGIKKLKKESTAYGPQLQELLELAQKAQALLGHQTNW